ncbi:MAG: IPT/TIG domain-containing protein [bacterium]
MIRRLVGYCFLLLSSISLLLTENVYSQIQFQRHTIDANFGGAYWVYAVDMDRDRDVDLVTASTKSGVDWWRNNNGSFSKNSVGSYRGTWAAFAADLDGDGDMDAMGGSSGVDQFAWFENKGGFVKRVLGNALGPESIHAADLDDDGDLDIIGAAWGDGKIYWWQNKGGGNFTQKTLDSSLRNAHSVYAADLDRDGRVDGIATGIAGTRWYRNEGNGNFTRKTINTKGGWCVFAADMDGDGDQDVLRTQRDNGNIVLFKNGGKGGFSSSIIESGYGECWSVVAGDVDGDGKNDIAAAGFDANNVMVWLNQGGGRFGKGIVVDNVNTVRGVYIADLDNDGDGDVVAAIRGDKDLAWYEVKGQAAPAKSITVISPNGGETLFGGKSFAVEWNSSGNLRAVTIEYSTDAGSSWTTVIDRTNNDGRYLWDVPALSTVQAFIRISDFSGTTSDVSDNVFDIAEPAKSITVNLPNGGEILYASTAHRIEWDSTGNITDVSIEYSPDGGGSWLTLANNTNNDGRYNWSVPTEKTDQGLVRISDAQDSGITDKSDDMFTVSSLPLSFTDITVAAGTAGPVKTGGHAVLFSDVDNDGRPDLYITMLFKDPMQDLFFRNTGNNLFVNEATLRGVADFDGGSHGSTFGDLDNDGDFDLFNGTTFGATGISSHNNILQNNGSGFFVDVTASTGIPEREWPTRGVVAFDMDRDGDLDLFAVSNYQGSADPPDERNEVYRNDGNMTFTAINSGDLYTAPAGQGATDTDYDGDGDIDIIASNRTGDVNILNNDGAGHFTLLPPSSLGISHQAGDGTTAGDVDNDGDLDLLLVPANSGFLYLNNGDGTFTFAQSFSETDGYMGAFADLDNDGDLDLVFSGDDVSYLNDGSGAFTPGPPIPVTGINDPRAVSFADIDNDGDLDIAFGVKRSRNWLVRNNYNSGNWLKIKLISPQGQAGAFGAKTRIYPAGEAGGQQLGLRESRSCNGYLGQNDQVVHFGLGSYSAVDVVVTFLDGTTITQTNVLANQTITVDASGKAPQIPIITAFIPISGPVGTEVTLVGSNFMSSTEIRFGSVAASSFTIDSDGQIRVMVPNAAATGKIQITNAEGTGLSATDFTVTAASGGSTFAFNPIHDSYVRSTRVNENNGASVKLKIRTTTSQRITFLKFQVSGITGTIQSAKLRLTVLDASAEGGSVYLVSNNYNNSASAWTENGLTWKNAPALSGNPLSTLGSVSLNQTVEFDVTSAVTDNGTYSFAVKTTSSDIVVYSSKEGAVAPELDVLTFDGAHPVPFISSFSPASGVTGTEVTIQGSDFTDATSVSFNGEPAGFAVDSDTQIRANVPAGGSSGPIAISNANGTGTSSQIFTLLTLPSITSFAPVNGPIGTIVTITGAGFSGATNVSFSGTSATTFSVDSDTQITATVPAGSITGPVSVTNAAGTTASASNFTVSAPPSTLILQPVHDSFVRSNVASKNYGGSTELRVRETSSAKYYTYLKFSVSGIGGPPLSAILKLYVIDPGSEGGTLYQASNSLPNSSTPWSEDNLTWNNAPALSGSPIATVGPVALNQVIELDVTSLITGDGDYSFILKNQSSDVVKYSSKEGPVAPELAVQPTGGAPSVPSISSFSPVSGGVGTEVTVIGNNFNGTTGVLFNGLAASSFTVDSNSQLRATVPQGATTGKINILNSDGTGSSSQDFSIISPPQITAFTPTSGPVGTTVTIVGSNFSEVAGITFNEKLSTNFTIFSSSEIHAQVPTGATNGVIVLINNAGSATSSSVFTVTTAPGISSFTPSSGTSGTEVTLLGNNFTGTVSVAFNGVSAAQFTVDSDTVIKATVPSGATTGKISVTSGNGAGLSASDFIITPTPVITSFSPPAGPVGSDVTVAGNHFNGATAVAFNGVAAAQFTVDSNTQITATVPNGATTGKISVTSAGGAATSASDFTIVLLPVVTAFSPSAGPIGTDVTLTGNHFTGATSVAFNGVSAAQFTVDSDTQIRATVPSGATTGKISVTSAGGAATSASDFTIVLLPVVTVFSPSAGPVGSEVTLTGNHFTGAASVAFNGVSAAQFTVDSDTQIRANVPSGASTGPISVHNDAGTGTSFSTFTVTIPSSLSFLPIHDSFVKTINPNKNYGTNIELRVRQPHLDSIRTFLKFDVIGLSGAVQGAVIRLKVINGSIDGGAIYSADNNYKNSSTPWVETGLLWGNAPAFSGAPLSVLGPVVLDDIVEFDVSAAIQTDGLYSFAIINNNNDAAKYSSKEGVLAPELVIDIASSANSPSITSFNPASGPVGAEVTVLGNNFNEITSVRFNGVTATFTVDSENQLRAVTPGGAVTGKITVVGNSGAGTSATDFTVLTAPALSSFAPTNGPVGTEVTILGSSFSGSSDVSFNGASAATFIVDSDTQIRAVVPANAASGPISVTNNIGLSTSNDDFTVTVAPALFTFLPTDDSFTRQRKASKNYGTFAELRVRKPRSGPVNVFLKFTVSGIGGSIVSAKIRLNVVDASSDGGSIFSISNNYDNTNTPWTELDINANNAPSISGTALSSVGSVSLNETVEFDVTAAMSRNGTYSFAIINSSSNVAKYSSKEGLVAPELLIETTVAVSAAKYTETDPQTEEPLNETHSAFLPQEIQLLPNYPNPFNMDTEIEYALPYAADVQLKIYNIRGQEVRSLVHEFQTAGFKSVRWNGTDNHNNGVSSGMYFIQLEVGKQRFLRKVALQK